MFAPESTVIDNLLYHVYQKSIAELLFKLLNVHDIDQSDELGKEIAIKQAYAIDKLIDKLRPEATEEDHLNGSSILSDVLDTKNYYQLICQRQNIQRIVDFALPEQTNHSSQNAALLVLSALVQAYHDRSQKRGNFNNDEDDVTTGAEDAADSPLVSVLTNNLEKFATHLSLPGAAPSFQIETSYEKTITPLGHLRVRLIELVVQLVKLGSDSILEKLLETDIFAEITRLTEAYPFNNFLQLKVQALFEDIFENVAPELRVRVIAKSNLVDVLTALGEQNQFQHQES